MWDTHIHTLALYLLSRIRKTSLLNSVCVVFSFLFFFFTVFDPTVAGFCGYLAGKLSYMKTCQEKFKRLENSPLGEIIRQKSGLPPLK